MIRKVVLIMFLVVLFSTSAFAIDGYGEVGYNMEDGSGYGKLVIYEDIAKLRLGIEMEAILMGYNLKMGAIPAGVPEAQTYYFFSEYELNETLTVFFKYGCKHYFSQAEGKTWVDDTSSVIVGGRYNF